jgi:putative transcriptional regulator
MLSGKLDESQIRYFIGYSGWDTGQLESELDEKAWIVYNRNLTNLLQIEHHQLWRTLMNELGGTYKEMANYPLDPSMN